MPLQGFVRALLPSASKAVLQPSDLLLRLLQMLLEQLLQVADVRRLGHFRNRFQQLLFGVKKVAELLHKEVLQGTRLSRIGAFGVDRRFGAILAAHLLQRRSVHKFPAIALIPWTTGVDLAVIAFAGRIIEELVRPIQRSARCARLRSAACPGSPAPP